MDIRRRHLTVEEVAELVNVHPHTVRRWLKDGRIEGTRLGPRAGYRIHEDEVRRVLDEGLRPKKATARDSLAAA